MGVMIIINEWQVGDEDDSVIVKVWWLLFSILQAGDDNYSIIGRLVMVIIWQVFDDDYMTNDKFVMMMAIDRFMKYMTTDRFGIIIIWQMVALWW